MPTADSQVIDAIEAAFTRGGDRALRAAYDAHGSLVYSFCRRSLSDDRAKDVTQDVFVSAWLARDRFDPSKGSLAGWLMGITKNRLIDNVRAEQRHAARRADSEPGDLPVESELERVGDRMLVADALKSLPGRHWRTPRTGRARRPTTDAEIMSRSVLVAAASVASVRLSPPSRQIVATICRLVA